ncbi:sugar phosphate isomerase/epimerase [Adhaeribacter swui]|uniref:Sugar phosphate isomerase/epimerase n=1 Tax=Adhaeribacter swui TaxID=2086471 RepID=A0A7G7GCR5_9BACT|nr:sugar phosphate isomerase/epimerase family protein [Adhaeribacter swui]QNF34949.1 sugar phosphate isomerase/epimerase [Adhaeribacter swui]
MKSTRRTFLKTSAMALAGSSLWARELLAAKPPKELLGIQLYSVRDEMKADPRGTLQQIAKMGYKHVEHAGYANGKFYGSTPVEFKKILADLGLNMPTGHSVLGKQHYDAATKDFTDNWKKTVADSAEVGQQFVISPSMDESLRKDLDGLKRFLEVFNKCGELCQKSGVKFGYHNHDFEFYTKLNNMTMFDIIMQNTDAKLVAQQLDIGNMYGAGGRALDIMKKYPGRFESMHVKDEIKSDQGSMSGYESTILGKGVVPVKEIVELGRKMGGTKHFIIEQESYQGKTPLACIQEDLEIMKEWGFKFI